MVRTRNHLLWLGPLLAVAGFISYFTVLVRYPTLRDRPWLNLLALAAAVTLSGLAVVRAFRRPRRLARALGVAGLALSAAVAGFFCFYVFHLSAQIPAPTATTLRLVEAPDFTATDHEGREVSLHSLRGKKVVLTFYRGHW